MAMSLSLGGDDVHELGRRCNSSPSVITSKTCDHAQGGGFAAAGRADQHDEFLVGDIQTELLHRDDALIGYLKIVLLIVWLYGVLPHLFHVDGVDLLRCS